MCHYFRLHLADEESEDFRLPFLWEKLVVENKDIGMRKTTLIEKLSVKLIAWMMTVIMFFLSMVSILYRSYIDVTYQEIIHYRKDNVVLAAIFVLAIIFSFRFYF